MNFFVANSQLSQTLPVRNSEVDMRRGSDQTADYHYGAKQHRMHQKQLQQEMFSRSASARLGRKEDSNYATQDSDRKREESMKRLLEWKQRMLQSPLTRKMSQTNNTLPFENRQSATEKLSIGGSFHKAKSETLNPENNYNSYSSDDEGKSAILLKVLLLFFINN